MKWNPETKRHERDTQDPLERVEAVRLVKTLMQLTACPDIVVKFHALRTQNLASDVIHRLFW